MLQTLRECVYTEKIDKNGHFVLAGDIGGTNTNFGVFDLKRPDYKLLLSFHLKSQTITDYTQLLVELIIYIERVYDITLKKTCIGIAGPVVSDRNKIQPTNLTVIIDAQAMRASCGIDVLLMNDFEAVGCGIDYVSSTDIVVVCPGIARPGAHRACIGAGTGMGKCLLVWHDGIKKYIPYASEGGHAECTGQTQFDQKLFSFVQQEKGDGLWVSWEDVLSGRGIQRLYAFLSTVKKYSITEITRLIEQESFKPDNISLYATQDQRCYDTMLLYITLYARCAKNFALDMLALNGLYISGGIATHNVELFKNPLFYQEFVEHNRFSSLLADMPLILIADYNVNLYGAVVFMQLYEHKVVV